MIQFHHAEDPEGSFLRGESGGRRTRRGLGDLTRRAASDSEKGVDVGPLSGPQELCSVAVYDRFPSLPPSNRYANTLNVAVFRNVFGIAVNIDDYDTEQHLQTKKATYKDIQKWVLDQFGEHVTNLDISRTKKLCGLAQNKYKGRKASAGYYVPKPREKKQELVLEALKHFGFIEEDG